MRSAASRSARTGSVQTRQTRKGQGSQGLTPTTTGSLMTGALRKLPIQVLELSRFRVERLDGDRSGGDGVLRAIAGDRGIKRSLKSPGFLIGRRHGVTALVQDDFLR